MNDAFIFFTSRIGLFITTVFVFAVFSFLQYIVPLCNEHPGWWKNAPQFLQIRFVRPSWVFRWFSDGTEDVVTNERTVEAGNLQDAVL